MAAPMVDGEPDLGDAFALPRACIDAFRAKGHVVVRGLAALNIDFFTQAPVPPPETGGGFGPAFVGTGMMVGMACLISIPLGLLSAVYRKVGTDRTGLAAALGQQPIR